ncbi:putative aldehyde dehydrogenase [Exophiala viscosa]|uniref:putative aldehyde dehydrogenase n=1 Tax=Exophiala viscosa TaxID=2486360 RepID=UPI002197C2C7|nr:putative aldehyde dehydrogenase [Exophiala viscosa]
MEEAAVKQVWRMLDENESRFHDALYADIRKPKVETQSYEIIGIKNEIIHTLEHLDEWAKPSAVDVFEEFKVNQPRVYKQPKGAVLIIGTWNYPLDLTLDLLISAISAGNTAVIKASENTPVTGKLLAELIPRYLDSESYRVVNGDKDQATELLKYHWAHILYTGGAKVARIVMAAASKHLTPVTLELGGKTPTIVTEKANIAIAAKRIAWVKVWNLGQTCMSTDYVLVHESVREQFVTELIKYIKTFAENSGVDGMSRLINNMHFHRISDMLAATKGKVAFGGHQDEAKLFVEPTIILDPALDDSTLESEIFGPLLPLITYKTLPEARDLITRIDPTPLGLYVMTEDNEQAEYFFTHIRSGGAAINDPMAQLAVPSVPFGGFGESGMGSYRGKAGFETFSHLKSAVTTFTDPASEQANEWRYALGDREEKFQLLKNLEIPLS